MNDHIDIWVRLIEPNEEVGVISQPMVLITLEDFNKIVERLDGEVKETAWAELSSEYRLTLVHYND